jgi:ribosome-associated translation inhibitor RaiA
MRFELRQRVLADDQARYAERRLRLALGRFGRSVRAVSVGVDNLTRPGGGVEKICRVVVRLAGRGTVRVEEADPDLYAAIDHAAARVDRAVSRELEGWLETNRRGTWV